MDNLLEEAQLWYFQGIYFIKEQYYWRSTDTQILYELQEVEI